MLLDLGREVDDYAQVPRDPAHGFVHPLSQLLQAQPLAAQYVQQPALLQRRGFRRAALAAVQQQGVVVLEVPECRGPHYPVPVPAFLARFHRRRIDSSAG